MCGIPNASSEGAKTRREKDQRNQNGGPNGNHPPELLDSTGGDVSDRRVARDVREHAPRVRAGRPLPPSRHRCHRYRGFASARAACLREALRQVAAELLQRCIQTCVGAPAHVARSIEHFLRAHLRNQVRMRAHDAPSATAHARARNKSARVPLVPMAPTLAQPPFR